MTDADGYHASGHGRSPASTPVAVPAREQPARTVMLIRHAEKPHRGEQGVTRRGRKSARSLTVRGWQRAGALVQLFRPGGTRHDALRVPVAIVASRTEARERSRRPRRTVKPLAELLHLRIDGRFDLDGERKLAKRLRTAVGPTLVCWHHEAIPTLAALIAPGLTIPAAWPDDRFDVVWVLEQWERDGPWSLVQVPQRLLAGDADTTIEVDADPAGS